jgi:hypothetical protein
MGNFKTESRFDFTRKVTFEQRHEEVKGSGYVSIWENILSRRKHKCKGTVAGGGEGMACTSKSEVRWLE